MKWFRYLMVALVVVLALFYINSVFAQQVPEIIFGESSADELWGHWPQKWHQEPLNVAERMEDHLIPHFQQILDTPAEERALFVLTSDEARFFLVFPDNGLKIAIAESENLVKWLREPGRKKEDLAKRTYDQMRAIRKKNELALSGRAFGVIVRIKPVSKEKVVKGNFDYIEAELLINGKSIGIISGDKFVIGSSLRKKDGKRDYFFDYRLDRCPAVGGSIPVLAIGVFVNPEKKPGPGFNGFFDGLEIAFGFIRFRDFKGIEWELGFNFESRAQLYRMVLFSPVDGNENFYDREPIYGGTLRTIFERQGAVESYPGKIRLKMGDRSVDVKEFF